jgi:polar amino acid transport system ATP-binding protein
LSTEAPKSAGGAPILVLERLVKRFGHRVVLDEVDLAVTPGEVVVLLGPSGTGKSTLLRCVNGLEEIEGGRILFEGREVLARSRSVIEIRKHIGMIFQNFNLYAHLSALDNVMLAPIKVLREPRNVVEARARELFSCRGRLLPAPALPGRPAAL